MAVDEEFLDGLTPHKMVGIVGRVMQKRHGKKRADLRNMDEVAEFAQEAALDKSMSIGDRLQAVGHCISLDKLNFEQEKLEAQIELAMMKVEAIGSGEKSEGPQVILVLPSNGSEVSAE